MAWGNNSLAVRSQYLIGSLASFRRFSGCRSVGDPSGTIPHYRERCPVVGNGIASEALPHLMLRMLQGLTHIFSP
jgi:hypothetical protein